VRFAVVAVAYVARAYEQFEGIVHVRIVEPLLLKVLNLVLTLLLVRAEPELLLITPEHLGLGLETQRSQEVVQVDYLRGYQSKEG